MNDISGLAIAGRAYLLRPEGGWVLESRKNFTIALDVVVVIGEGCQTGALALGRVAQPLPCCLAKVSQGLNNLISCCFPMHISCILSMGQSQPEVRGSLCFSWSSVSQAQSRRETRVWIWRGKWKISCILNIHFVKSISPSNKYKSPSCISPFVHL